MLTNHPVLGVLLIGTAMLVVGGVVLAIDSDPGPATTPTVQAQPTVAMQAPPPALPPPAPAPVQAQSTVLHPNCETLVTHRDGLTDGEITVIEQNAHRLGMSPDELLYWQTQARAKGMDPYAWDTIKLASKMTHAPEAPVCVPHSDPRSERIIWGEWSSNTGWDQKARLGRSRAPMRHPHLPIHRGRYSSHYPLGAVSDARV